ncbi:oxidoreductase [Candidatus Woesebacteria bacterium]|nr:oxidoreductase [Candidatus Woesebacteria bacterium]
MSYTIDYFLDRITMYRLALYYLIALSLISFFLSVFGVFIYSPVSIILSLSFLVCVCWLTNKVFAKVYEAPTNIESVYITSLILFLIITPPQTIHGYVFLGWAGVLAIASKFILAIKKKHIFNPAAIAVLLTSFGIGRSASWWIGNAYVMLPVLIGGILIVKKTQRELLVSSFFITAFIIELFFGLNRGVAILSILDKTILHSPFLFFGFIMLTEPLTTPPTKILQGTYGFIVGLIFSPQVRLGTFYSTPELTLFLGNIFSYVVSPKQKLILYLREKIQISPDTFDFVFDLTEKIKYIPGQYMEWMLEHINPDSRGNRRYLTLASSPTENSLRIGVKFSPDGSSYKRSLLKMDNNSKIVASQLSGEFVLPPDAGKKLVFVAGGIGVTPFRSMVKYLIDKNEKRDIVILYSNKLATEIVYKDVFDQAFQQLGIRTVYTLTDETQIPIGWEGKVGRINEQVIGGEIPDFRERTFYLSGPHQMVTSFEETLYKMGISKRQIKKDFFPGYA